MTNIKIIPVTNNIVDVFFGEYGFESKEWVRMKRGQGTWIVSSNRQNRVRDAEFDFGSVVRLEDVKKDIMEELNGLKTTK